MAMQEHEMIKKELPPLHDRVFGVLRRGEQQAKTTTEIIQELQLKEKDRRSVNAALSDLSAKYGKVVGSVAGGPASPTGNRGHFLIETQREFDRALHTLESRRIHLEKRISGLSESWRKKHGEN